MPRIISLTNLKLNGCRSTVQIQKIMTVIKDNILYLYSVLVLRGFNVINSYTRAEKTAALLNVQTPQSFSCNTAKPDNTDLWFLHRPTHKQ